MTGQIAGYNTGDIASGLQSLGLAAGDTAFVHTARCGRWVGWKEVRRPLWRPSWMCWGRKAR